MYWFLFCVGIYAIVHFKVIFFLLLRIPDLRAVDADLKIGGLLYCYLQTVMIILFALLMSSFDFHRVPIVDNYYS